MSKSHPSGTSPSSKPPAIPAVVEPVTLPPNVLTIAAADPSIIRTTASTSDQDKQEADRRGGHAQAVFDRIRDEERRKREDARRSKDLERELWRRAYVDGNATVQAERLTDSEEAVDECIRRLGTATLKVLKRETGISVNSLTTHVIPALKRKRGLKSRPYRYTT